MNYLSIVNSKLVLEKNRRPAVVIESLDQLDPNVVYQCSSSLDFPEESGAGPDVIAMCDAIRNGRWRPGFPAKKAPLWGALNGQEKYDVLRRMQQYGSGFASKLADAWFVADGANSSALGAAFDDMVRKYHNGGY